MDVIDCQKFGKSKKKASSKILLAPGNAGKQTPLSTEYNNGALKREIAHRAFPSLLTGERGEIIR
jgi:hypothetical protein